MEHLYGYCGMFVFLCSLCNDPIKDSNEVIIDNIEDDIHEAGKILCKKDENRRCFTLELLLFSIKHHH